MTEWDIPNQSVFFLFATIVDSHQLQIKNNKTSRLHSALLLFTPKVRVGQSEDGRSCPAVRALGTNLIQRLENQ